MSRYESKMHVLSLEVSRKQVRAVERLSAPSILARERRLWAMIQFMSPIYIQTLVSCALRIASDIRASHLLCSALVKT